MCCIHIFSKRKLLYLFLIQQHLPLILFVKINDIYKKELPSKSLNLQVLVVIPINNYDTRHVYIAVYDNT